TFSTSKSEKSLLCQDERIEDSKKRGTAPIIKEIEFINSYKSMILLLVAINGLSLKDN
ncbi:unnamed protein product, partial [marine sediment metagenome]